MFIFIAIIAGKQLLNILPSDSYAELYGENTYLSNKLLQPGYPLDWTPGNVLIPGFASSNRLDKTKLDNLNTFSYDEIKSFYHISSEFIFYFREDAGIINISNKCNYGFAISTNLSTCEPNFQSLGYSDLVKSSRLIIYNSSIIEMVLFSWN